MKNRLYLVFGVLLVVALGGLLWWTARYSFAPLPPEPAYGGLVKSTVSRDSRRSVVHPEPVYEVHPLSYWLTRRYRFPGLAAEGSGIYDPLPTSLLSDSNAVPFLVRALRRDSWVGQAYYRKQVWPKLPLRIKAHLPTPPADNWQVRENAAGLLGRMGPLAEASISALGRAVREDESYRVRLMAAVALSYLRRGDRMAREALNVELQETNSWGRKAAATNALISIDPVAAVKAGVQIPTIITLDPGAAVEAGVPIGMLLWAANALPDARRAVADALAHGDNRVIAAYAAGLNDTDPNVRYNAGLGLAELYPNIAAKAGVKNLEDSDTGIRLSAVTVLGHVGKRDINAIAGLVEALRDAEYEVRSAATNWLRRVDPEAAAKAGVKPPFP
jgi:hypothetical protein